MKDIIKSEIIKDLNNLLVKYKPHNLNTDGLFQIILAHEELTAAKKKLGIRKQVEDMRLEAEYQRLAKELQANEFDRASEERNFVGNFLCDLSVKIDLQTKEKGEKAAFNIFVKVRDEMLKAFAIDKEEFDDIYAKHFVKEQEKWQKQSSTTKE